MHVYPPPLITFQPTDSSFICYEYHATTGHYYLVLNFIYHDLHSSYST
jgi:hypothetical protein